MNFARAISKLDRLYAELPRLDCQRRCTEACGPILMSRIEQQRIAARVGGPIPPMSAASLTCPLLRDGGCDVYEVRPAICRLFGLVPAMACPFGCEPERWLSDQEAADFLARTHVIGGPVVSLSGAARPMICPRPKDLGAAGCAGSPTALTYIDDRAWRCEGRFPSADEIHAARPWNKPTHHEGQL